MRRWIGLFVAATLLAGSGSGSVARAKELERPPELKGAFIREGDLWLKEGRKERLLADRSAPVRAVAWSGDGRWLAYETQEPSDEIWVYRVKDGKETKLCGGCGESAWAHREAKLAYRMDGGVYTVNMSGENGLPSRPIRRADGVGRFGWLPDDRGLLAASLPMREGDEWKPLTLYAVRIRGVDGETKPLITLPGPTERFLAVSVSPFRWSPDGRWVAFVAEPTASWSMDSNTLCLLSADGARFFAVGKMLSREDWYGWAPGRSRLGYIDGEGRFEVSNKRFEYKDAPSSIAPSYTPPGVMDLGFAWLRPDLVVVSRAPELSWDEGPVPNAEPSLYALDLKTGSAQRLTRPPEGNGDFHPMYVASAKRLTWVRAAGRPRYPADVWTSTARGAGAAAYIRDVDAPPVWLELRR
ncbi:hypothetical protein [Paenibacillus sp.]|uniref:TolB family protein n=1 Tax=Paenibacillus sp. TaxID=58172 RepID=UPI002810D3E1|nr:hypothetical protein [Paenibacillus sp.]